MRPDLILCSWNKIKNEQEGKIEGEKKQSGGTTRRNLLNCRFGELTDLAEADFSKLYIHITIQKVHRNEAMPIPFH